MWQRSKKNRYLEQRLEKLLVGFGKHGKPLGVGQEQRRGDDDSLQKQRGQVATLQPQRRGYQPYCGR
jgi:hypothetical protein